MRPLLQIAPRRFEEESLQGLAKFSSFQLWSSLFGSSKDLLRFVRHASSLGSDKILGIRLIHHHTNTTLPTSIPDYDDEFFIPYTIQIEIHPRKNTGKRDLYI